MKPYYEDEHVQLFCGDMREVLPALGKFDACVTDPPYQETSLKWDRWVDGWPALVAEHTRSLWCFGSMRMFLDRRDEFPGWRLSQDVVWEKPTGSGFATPDRFLRVHEHVLHFYRGDWSAIRHEPPRRPYYGPNKTWRSTSFEQAPRSEHRGEIGRREGYEDDGTRLIRSVIQSANVCGGIHRTQKPVPLLAPLIEYAVPVGGLVLDVFAGSASTLLTARQLGRRAVGIEGNEEYCERAAERLGLPDLFGGAA